MSALSSLTIHELRQKLDAGETSPREIVEDLFKKIDAVEPKIRAFLQLDREKILKQAEKSPKNSSPLAGIPVGIKDVINVKDEICTCGSKILRGYTAPYDATAIAKLRKSGAILFGRLNMDEFAMGSSTENSAFGVTRNPWDLERIPGGSSGGSAAAVAADEVPVALGTDTGGSIRQPAAMCGVVGLKPTYGRVSRYGLVAFASSLDQIGPFAKDVEDAAILLGAISGHDPKDSTSVPEPVPDYRAEILRFAQDDNGGVKNLRLGLPKEYFVGGLDKEIESAIRASVKKFEELGAKIVEISLPHTEFAIAVYYIIATAEASANLARFDGVRYGFRAPNVRDVMEMYGQTRAEGFGPEVKRRIILGTYVLSSGYYDAYYLRAQKVRTLIRRDFEQAFQKCDAILTPTSPTAAFKFGEKTDDPLQMYLSDIFTISCNLAGICGISIPCGFTSGNLPIGLQILGKPFGEPTILRVAHAYEQATEWHKRKPPLN
jgi:aspartyl-tRNA(Asn)/glutamyl-tRNA(Gln) amidotransferase subunit A